jgi:3',5'-cyclic AMP phosphodiesterase CpdA
MAAGATVGGLAASPSAGPSSAHLWRRSGPSEAPRVAGLHLQFGGDAAREAVVSWHTVGSVADPVVRFGTPDAGFGSTAEAETVAYRDAKSGIEVAVHHARLTGLNPDTAYVYAAAHRGATPELGTLRTAPSGRAAFRFTSFGDQGTPTVGRHLPGAPGGFPGQSGYVNDNLGSPFAGDVTAAVERCDPLFHLVNGDLCYASLARDRVRTWDDWFANTSRSARNRPWMPAPGNHENEVGNGPIGFQAFQTYFRLPDAGAESHARGLWYAFTVGAMRVIALANDDICYQDSGDRYVRGYSGGAQRRWLERELAAARADRAIDWIVVVMHQTAISTAGAPFNGADRAIREQWLPLFDAYQVDLVLCGHEHHYERSHPVRGALGGDTLTPTPVATDTKLIDTSKGTVHLVIGGGGTSAPSNGLLFPRPRCRVITGVGAPDSVTGRRPAEYVEEDAPWSAFRDAEHPYGFCAFDVDPGRPGGNTSIAVTYYAVSGATLTPVDSFTLTRPRRD